MKIAVVYWSGTGNTKAMAEAMVEGAISAGAEVELFSVDGFSADKMSDYWEINILLFLFHHNHALV